MTHVAGKGAVITGGASGIGYATAVELGRRRARVVIADIEGDALEAAVERLRAAGTEAHGVVCDVTSLDAVQDLARRSFELLGAVHIVFNNAGVAMAAPLAQMSHDEWRWVIDVDLWGPIHGVEAFVPRLIEQGDGGHVAFTASFAGLVPNVGLGAYTVAKYGVVGLAEVLRRELRAYGIGVTVLCPMRVGTRIDQSERNRAATYGEARPTPAILDPNAEIGGLSGPVLPVEGVAALTVAAIEADRLYVLPHRESRVSIQRRFAQIDRTFDEQPSV
jgi:NAD(P)-dependent dehydrogenase (short-subunit alcohol dehydrogenase family)